MTGYAYKINVYLGKNQNTKDDEIDGDISNYEMSHTSSINTSPNCTKTVGM
jgi:hypothetical protein